jgi:hypothetical protein
VRCKAQGVGIYLECIIDVLDLQLPVALLHRLAGLDELRVLVVVAVRVQHRLLKDTGVVRHTPAGSQRKEKRAVTKRARHANTWNL